MLLSGEYTQLDVATQFGFTAPSVNTHVHKHIPIDMAEALDDIIIRSLQKNLAAKDGGDLIRLIEYRDKTEKKKLQSIESEFVESIDQRIEALKRFLAVYLQDPDRIDYVCDLIRVTMVEKLDSGGVLQYVLQKIEAEAQ